MKEHCYNAKCKENKISARAPKRINYACKLNGKQVFFRFPPPQSFIVKLNNRVHGGKTTRRLQRTLQNIMQFYWKIRQKVLSNLL